ncbi:MAG: UDP-N-acetylmuramate dehydrogenase [Bacteroidota bacterium]
MIVQRDVSLKPYNTFGINENTEFLAVVDSVDDLDEIFLSSRFRSQRKMVLGEGSNILFTTGFKGVVAKNEIKGLHILSESKEEVFVSVGSGENWHQFVLWCIEKGYGGVENLSLIPGSVGAAPIQNIGAYGVELKEVFHSLEAYEIQSGKVIIFYRDDCKFGYRYSVFKGELKDRYVITKVNFKLKKKPKLNISYGDIKVTLAQMGVEEPTLKNVSQAVINVRQSKLPDPMDIGNAGSFFKNPVLEKLHYEALEAQFPDIKSYQMDKEHVKVPAGWLIEKAGWKGYKNGDYGVHEKQALVLVNYHGTQGKDILKLSRQIQRSIQKKFGIELELEVNII